MGDPVRILVADDHTLVRQGYLVLLKAQPDFIVVGEAGDGQEVVKLAGKLSPDVIIMDIGMPILNGMEAARQIKKENPKVKIVFLSMHTDQAYIYQSLLAGASGYLIKQGAAKELIDAIRASIAGNIYLSPLISQQVVESYLMNQKAAQAVETASPLTTRERQILQMIAEGLTAKEIASQLNISLKTVDAHRSNIMSKLQINNLPGLVKYALQQRIISLDE